MGLEMYYEAFTELSTCRNAGMSVGPIPWTAIDRYGQRYGFQGDGFDYLVRMVRALDDTFLAHSRKKAKEEEAQNNAGSGRIREED